LELGGVDALSIVAPSHEASTLAKKPDDHHLAARAKRQGIRHIGADEPKRPLPFGRESR
jgi:hypothetical protein